MGHTLGTNLLNLLSHTDLAVVISAELESNKPNVNAVRTNQLERDLINTGLRYCRVDGCYQGTKEKAFIVMCNDLHDVMRIECLGIHKYKQDSILIVDQSKCLAMLKYADVCTAIGRGFEQVESSKGLDNYMVVDGETWVIV